MANILDTSIHLADRLFRPGFEFKSANTEINTIAKLQALVKGPSKVTNSHSASEYAVFGQRVAWQALFLIQTLEALRAKRIEDGMVESKTLKQYVDEKAPNVPIRLEEALNSLIGSEFASRTSAQVTVATDFDLIADDPGPALMLQALTSASISTGILAYYSDASLQTKLKTAAKNTYDRLSRYFALNNGDIAGKTIKLGPEARDNYGASSPNHRKFRYKDSASNILKTPSARHNTSILWVVALGSYQKLVGGGKAADATLLDSVVNNFYDTFMTTNTGYPGYLAIGGNGINGRWSTKATERSESSRSFASSTGYDGYVTAALVWALMASKRTAAKYHNTPLTESEKTNSTAFKAAKLNAQYWNNLLNANGYGGMVSEPGTGKEIKLVNGIPSDIHWGTTEFRNSILTPSQLYDRAAQYPAVLDSSSSKAITKAQWDGYRTWYNGVSNDPTTNAFLNELATSIYKMQDSAEITPKNWIHIPMEDLRPIVDLTYIEHIESGTAYLYTVAGVAGDTTLWQNIESKLKALESSTSTDNKYRKLGTDTNMAATNTTGRPIVVKAASARVSGGHRALSGLYFLMALGIKDA